MGVMTPPLAGLAGLGLLLMLMFSGVPVYASLILTGIGGLTYLLGLDGALFQAATISFEVASNYDLLILPFFIFMAGIFVTSGLGKSLYKLAYAWLGSLPGGLCLATVATCALFGAVCASETATTSTMGMIAIREMRRYKYDASIACGSVASADTLATLIPPSSVLVIYGLLTEQSIGELFIAGIIPGIVLMIMMLLMVVTRCKINPELGPKGPKTNFKEKGSVFLYNLETLGLAAFVILGIMMGWVTPTEAGAFGAAGAIIISVARRRIDWGGFKGSVLESLKLIGMLYAIIVGAFLFVNFIVLSKIPFAIGDFIRSLDLPPLAVMGIIMPIFIILGCFVEVVAMIVILVPIFFPIVIELGFSPVWFGVVMVVMAGIASITPPLGLSAYVIKGIVPDVRLATIFRGAFPFFLTFVAFLILILFFPQIVLFLPGFMIRG